MRAVARWPTLSALALAVSLVPATVHAQSTERVNENDVVRPPAPPVEHRFLDSLNLALTGLESGALAADGFYTQMALRRHPGVLFEANPVARPFVSRGWPGMIAGGALFVSADLGIRYLLHRAGHHRMERWLPSILISAGTFGALNNAQAIRDVERAGQKPQKY